MLGLHTAAGSVRYRFFGWPGTVCVAVNFKSVVMCLLFGC
jgi:hypothetical protein